MTRTGEDAAGEVHDRMPVFLTPAAWVPGSTRRRSTSTRPAIYLTCSTSNPARSRRPCRPVRCLVR
ncbi:SOS response-associated peptidase [Dietzia cinnamea]|uniref:SOS response-associated peptidase n=1 Tax=Dietzia cinnamea TaxID=321318 RepID=UPI0021A2794A|nr:SOS response-associated peptidase [Dietzia cinnamea]MCT1713445.1 SOS response-associated peptidase [Dietzia cinnamea]